MSIPAQPTTTNQATEALKLYGIASPTTAEVTRAVSYGLEMVKSDLKDMGLEWSFLRKTAYRTITAFDSKVQMPTDFAKPLSAQILKCIDTGTLQAAAASTLTLAAADSHTAEEIEGRYIAIVDGTGNNQALQCKDFNTTTKVATMTESWTTTPDGTETYAIVDSTHELELQAVWNLDEITHPETTAMPRVGYHDADSSTGDIYFDFTPDDTYTYVLKIRYYADILQEDVTSTLYNRMLYLLNGLFIQGIFVWALQDDTRFQVENGKYREKLNRTAALYLYPNQVSGEGSILDYK